MDHRLHDEGLDRLRRLADLLVTESLTDDEWARLGDVVDDVLAAHPTGVDGAATRYTTLFRRGVEEGSEPGTAEHPIASGRSLSFPPFEGDWDGHRYVARARFGPAFEGPPGVVHGGFIAAAFDVIVSSAASRLEPLPVTRRLTVRYLRPSPLGERLVFEADPVRGDGRQVFVTCRLADARGRTLGRAEGECAGLDPERFGDRFPARPSDDAPAVATASATSAASASAASSATGTSPATTSPVADPDPR
ncbi:MAG: PaaI family thioesterase [Acidimicrobiales bacterium]